MSELKPVDIIPDPSRYAVAGAIVGVLAAIVLPPGAIYGLERLSPTQHEPSVEPQPSRIVAGVRGQIESHEGSIKQPRLLIEQCNYDVHAAYQGKSTLSFSWKLGKIARGCYEDSAVVATSVWQHFKNGEEIIFAGPTGAPLAK